MNPNAGVLDRIEQSFVIYKNHFLDFFTPMFIYNLISFLVFGVAFMAFAVGSISTIDINNMDIFSFLNNQKIVILITVSMVLFIAYLLLYIPILLGLLKSVKQAVNNEEITTKQNLMYGFLNLSNSFKTYWYIFAYVALVPALFFIAGGLLFNFGYYNNSDILKQVGLFLMILGGILFLVFSVYRGIKTKFSIYSALNNDAYSKEDFTNSINITNNNWWRIVGNYILVGIIIILLSSIISGILGFATYSSIDYTSINNIDDLKNIISNFSILSESLSGFVNTIISTILSIFIIIFTYIFYLRLRNESIIVPQKGNIEL